MNIVAVLPDLSTKPFAHILPSLERHEISVADLLSIEASDVAKRAQVPVREVKKLTEAINKALSAQYNLDGDEEDAKGSSAVKKSQTSGSSLVHSGLQLLDRWKCISVLDNVLDAALKGGIPTGYVTEITGQSGVGKTQFLLTLLLSVQLPSPQGLGRSAIYISTEAPLQTSRLTQIIEGHPSLSSLDASTRPSLSRILSIQTPDLESQEHILRYQVPVVAERQNVGLLVIDSVTNNYRAEFTRQGERGRPGATMAKRSAQLMELGALLRDLARTADLAVVVANQVGDRFSSVQGTTPGFTSNPAHQEPSRISQGSYVLSSPSQPSASSADAGPTGEAQSSKLDDLFTLEHQQRWFTGWGDISPFHDDSGLKTPSLGLVWANEIACRIALVKHWNHRPSAGVDEKTEMFKTQGPEWVRYFKLVFAPWAPSMDGTRGVEFRIERGGVRAFASASGKPPDQPVQAQVQAQTPDKVEEMRDAIEVAKS